MSESKGHDINPDVVESAVMLGLCDDEQGCRGRIADLVKEAAPVTHPEGNLRHNDWIFKVVEGVVENVGIINCNACGDTKRETVWDECPACQGDGCKACHWEGAKPKTIPCQSCK